MKKIIIIGSGLSGLSCASYLDSSKYDIKLFESSNAPGGRARSDKVDGYICDRGFQVLLNNYNEIKKLDIYKDLDLKYFNSGAMVHLDEKILKIYNPLAHPIKFFTSNFFSIFTIKDIYNIITFLIIKKKSSCKSASDILKENLSSKSQELFFHPFFKGIFLNESLSNDSSFFIKIFKKFAFGKASIPKGGMSDLPQSIIKKNNLNISYNHKLSHIKNNTAFFENSKQEAYDIIIFAVPINTINRILNTKYEASYYSNMTTYISSPQNVLGKSILLIPQKKYFSNSIQCLSNVSTSYTKNNDYLYSVSSLDHKVTQDILLDEFVEICKVERENCSIVKSYSIPRSLHSKNSDIDSDGEMYFCGDWKYEPSIDGALKSGRIIAEQVNSFSSK